MSASTAVPIPDALASALERPPTDAPRWRQRERQEAADRLRRDGLPGPSLEEWRFTPLTPLFKVDWSPVVPASLEVDPSVTTLRIEPDRIRVPAKLPSGVKIGPLAERAEESGAVGAVGEVAVGSRAFAALNSALYASGAWVRVEGEVGEPLVVEVSTDTADALVVPRLRFELAERARICVVERYRGEGRYFCNPVTEVVVGRGSRLDHVRWESESSRGFHIGSLVARLHRDGCYASTVVSVGAKLSRLDLEVVLEDEGAEALLSGLFLGSGERLVDHHTHIDHRRERGTSRQNYRGILAGRSVGVFDGCITVRRDAQKTSASQENRNLLLCPQARVHTKPMLQIDADDVSCRHGATVGQLDPDALFYLRSRGLDPRAAQSMLVEGFAMDVLREVPNDLMEGLERDLAPHLQALLEEV